VAELPPEFAQVTGPEPGVGGDAPVLDGVARMLRGQLLVDPAHFVLGDGESSDRGGELFAEHGGPLDGG
jgi:hypothetical protein